MASKKAFDDLAGATEEDDEASERALTLLVWWVGRERSDLRPMVDVMDVVVFLVRGDVAVLRRIAVLKTDAISLIVLQRSSYTQRSRIDEVVEAMIMY